ncbi:hypothetical protein [Anaerotruncus rubiinfantis]|uniref:hypothetical protein n=1 Tax=Anaerotruncus rubiinfantis TaxID=1720200 RepID=UPI00082B4B7A|nr:hypothetical protein [Anaerotruncus rubiinfantis]
MTEVKFRSAKIEYIDGYWLCLKLEKESLGAARRFLFNMKDRLHIAELKMFRQRRSLDANAYCWVLLESLAQAVGSDKDSLYLEMIERYGVFLHAIVPPKAVEILRRDYRKIRELGPVTVNGKPGMQCQCYEGSSRYDTAQMSRFLDGIVQECKDLDIETATPDELARMKREWNQ